MPEPAIEIKEVAFAWNSNGTVITIPDFSVMQGERLFISGPSGSGKSTLLNLLGGMLRPQEGLISILGNDLTSLKNSKVDRLRAEAMGVIFQQFNLIPYLSVIDNVTLPCSLSSVRKASAESHYGSLDEGARYLLAQLGLDDNALLTRSVMALSTGQQQRVAVARALLGNPKIVLADEPTSALDTDLRDQFLHLLTDLCDHFNTTLLFVSHDAALQKYFERVETLTPSESGGFVL